MFDTRFHKLLLNRHKDERVVIVANGPSLNDMNLSFLKNEITIGLNKIFLGFSKYSFYPRYYVSVNRKIIEQSVEQIQKMNCVKFIGNKAGKLFKKDPLTYIINTTHSKQDFSIDIAISVTEGWTVTYAALQIAYYLGFKEVIIIGLDHRYEITGKPNQAQILHGPDLNHFCTEYFGFGKKWDNPDLVNSEKSYKKANIIFQNANRNIYDATVNGACNVFEKIDYNSYFNISS